MSGDVAPKNLPQSESQVLLWFVARGSVLKGPYTTQQLEGAIKSREISHLDFCWKQGYNEWRPIASIDAFERRKEMRILPEYPSVAVPSSSKNSETSADQKNRSPLSLVPRREQNIKISFARSPRQAISLYEWGLALIGGVALAYFSTIFALNEVKRGVETRFELAFLGRAEKVGHNRWSTLPLAWDPLYSAPEFVDLVKDSSYLSPLRSAPPLNFQLPVRIEGPLLKSQDRRPAQVLSYDVSDADTLQAWDPTHRDLDPVYVKPLLIEAQINPLNPRQLSILQAGEPYLNNAF